MNHDWDLSTTNHSLSVISRSKRTRRFSAPLCDVVEIVQRGVGAEAGAEPQCARAPRPMHTAAHQGPRSGDCEQTESAIFRQYYKDYELLVAPEGILKVLSAVACIVLGVLHVSGAGAAGAACAAARGAGGAAPLAGACACALLFAALALRLPRHAPVLYLYLDLISSAVVGVGLLITAVFTMWSCGMDTIAGYVLGPLGILSAMMVTASAVLTYVSVMRLWDKCHTPWESPRPLTEEQDV